MQQTRQKQDKPWSTAKYYDAHYSRYYLIRYRSRHCRRVHLKREILTSSPSKQKKKHKYIVRRFRRLLLNTGIGVSSSDVWICVWQTFGECPAVATARSGETNWLNYRNVRMRQLGQHVKITHIYNRRWHFTEEAWCSYCGSRDILSRCRLWAVVADVFFFFVRLWDA